MDRGRFKGIVVPMVTPFKENINQDVDEEKIRNLVNFFIDSGVNVLMPCGGTGESVSLSKKENKRIVEIVVDETNGRVPVIGGAKSPGTRNSIELAEDVKDVGADAALIQGPYYLDPITDEGFYQHFKTVSDQVDIPILIYNLERIQEGDIPISVIQKLYDLDNVIGLKNSTINLKHISDGIKISKESKKLYFQGKGELFFPSLALGAHGSITSIINAVPSFFVDIYKSFTSGNVDRAKDVHYKLMPLFKFGTSPSVCKAALELLGIPVGPPRKPLMPVSDEQKLRIKEILINLGLIS
jgi:4-hydroxy-tetrahydrodipicolinate synthase